MWSTQRLNDMDRYPWSATPRELTWRDTCATGDLPTFGLSLRPSRSGGLPEAPAVLVSLGISVPCQMMLTDLQMACTPEHRRLPLLTPSYSTRTARRWFSRSYVRGAKRVSRPVGGLVLKQVRCGGSGWSTRRLTDLDPRTSPATPLAPIGRDTRTTLVPHYSRDQPWRPSRRPAGGMVDLRSGGALRR
jgi:hypothetical protein